ncbi:HEAT repeat domain-containing protein [Rosistilla oblonga]|uniref:HEAT repeat domain-containing protein n=1 Tax=Rosistilla oblonga TaxID=2527990 RepID=UPI003A985FAA
MFSIKFVIRFALAWLGLFALPASAETRQLELHTAIESGAVSVRIDFLGGAMGDRMKIYLRKQTAGDLQLKVTPGTLFLPQGGDVQRLAAVGLKGKLTAQGTYRRTAAIELNDSSEQGFLTQVVCIDYHKNSPPAGQAFIIGAVEPRCQRILSVRGDLSIWAYQSAIWIDRAGVSPSKLQATFQVASTDLQAAADLLKEAEAAGAASLAEVDVSVEAKASARGIFSADPAVRAQAHAEVQTLDPADRAKLDALLKLNVLRGGKLPTAEELRAGSTLESLIPAGIELPKLEIPQSVDDIMAMVDAIRKQAADGQAGDKIADLASLKLLPHLAGLKARLPLLRIAAARAIANVKDPVAVEALLVALQDRDARVRAAAAAGLEKLTQQNFGDDTEKWTAWWQEAHVSFGTFEPTQ